MADRNAVVRWLWVTFLALPIGAFVGCRRTPEPTPPPVITTVNTADIEKQVHTFCGSACHAYPPADSFPRKHWRTEVERGFRFYEQSGLSLSVPPIEAVIRYYEEKAPEELPQAKYQPASKPLDVKFEKVSYPPPSYSKRPAIANVKLVHLPANLQVREASKDPLAILACDMQEGHVLLLRPTAAKPAWTVLADVPNPAHAEVLDFDGDGLLDIIVANLGSFPPTDRRCGSVVWLRGQSDGTFKSITLLDNVGRVADVQVADFRGTGKLDLIIGVFGLHATGEIIFLENQTTNWNAPKFNPTSIDARHGAIHVPVIDLNNDGKPDFIALIAQEYETVVAFINEGGGKFRTKSLYAAPHPGYGSSGIQLVDMNGDGKLDVLYTNGDILDEPYLLKPYHGVQWLENKGNLEFTHHAITPMYGVHHAQAADVFGTGRPAVVAVSFLPGDKFPDRITRNVDAAVLLEQVAPGRFERHTLASIDCDATVCAVGDLYGTGRLDIVIGNFSGLTSDHPVTIWKNQGRRVTPP
jgi:hypothetical protein